MNKRTYSHIISKTRVAPLFFFSQQQYPIFHLITISFHHDLGLFSLDQLPYTKHPWVSTLFYINVTIIYDLLEFERTTAVFQVGSVYRSEFNQIRLGSFTKKECLCSH